MTLTNGLPHSSTVQLKPLSCHLFLYRTHRLRGIHKHLTESIGVSSWEDLKETLADAELKENIFNFAKALGEKEYSNLLNAIENTTDLRGEVPEPEVASVQVAKEGTPLSHHFFNL